MHLYIKQIIYLNIYISNINIIIFIIYLICVLLICYNLSENLWLSSGHLGILHRTSMHNLSGLSSLDAIIYMKVAGICVKGFMLFYR